MQLNRNSSQNTGKNLSFFFIFTYYYMVFKMALILVLEKKESIFIFSCKIFRGCLKKCSRNDYI